MNNNSSNVNEPLQSIKRTSVTSRSLLVIGVLIFIINMFFAWWIVFESKDFITQSLVSSDGSTKKVMDFVFENLNQAKANEILLRTRILETEVHLKAIANKQTLSVVAMAASFGLLAIGFALFVMGIESSFQLSGSAEQVGKVVLKASSPGLICFILAALILIVTSQTKHEMSFGSLSVYPDNTGNNVFDKKLILNDNKSSKTDLISDVTVFSKKVAQLSKDVQNANRISILHSMNKPLSSTIGIPTLKDRDSAINSVSQGILKETTAIYNSLSNQYQSDSWPLDSKVNWSYDKSLIDFKTYSKALNRLVSKINKPKSQTAFVRDRIPDFFLATSERSESRGYIGMASISNIRLICISQPDRHFVYTLIHKELAYEARVFPLMYKAFGNKLFYNMGGNGEGVRLKDQLDKTVNWAGFWGIQKIIFEYPKNTNSAVKELQKYLSYFSLNEVIILNGDLLRRSLFDKKKPHSEIIFDKWNQDVKNWPYSLKPDDFVVRELSNIFSQRLNEYTYFINSQLYSKEIYKTIPSFFQSSEVVIKEYAKKWKGDYSELNKNEKLIVIPLSMLISEIESYSEIVVGRGEKTEDLPSFFEWDAQTTRLKMINGTIKKIIRNPKSRERKYRPTYPFGMGVLSKNNWWELLGDLFRNREGLEWNIQLKTKENILLNPLENVDFNREMKSISFSEKQNINLLDIKMVTVAW